MAKTYGNFLFEMIKYVKDILIYKISKKADIYSDEEIKEIAQIAENVSKEELINIIYKLSELENKMKWSTQKTIIFQTEIIKLCVKQDTKSIEERIENIEKKISEGTITSQISPTGEKQIPKFAISEEKEPKKVPEKKPQTENKPEQKKLANGNAIAKWSDVLSDLKKQGKVILYANLIGTDAVEINDMTVEIRFNNGLNAFRKELLQKPENLNVLTKEIAMLCGKPMQIKFEDASGNSANIKKEIKKAQPEEPKKNIEEDIENLDIPINIIEE